MKGSVSQSVSKANLPQTHSVKHYRIVCIFSGLVTPKLQTSGLTRKDRPFFTAYQTHFLRQYQMKIAI